MPLGSLGSDTSATKLQVAPDTAMSAPLDEKPWNLKLVAVAVLPLGAVRSTVSVLMGATSVWVSTSSISVGRPAPSGGVATMRTLGGSAATSLSAYEPLASVVAVVDSRLPVVGSTACT